MPEQKTAPYGSWLSPITSDLIVAGGVGLGQIALDGDAIYWTETRPTENGRSALVKWTRQTGIEEMSAAGFNVRTRVHEYGGGEYTVHDDVIYFANFVDQRLYVQYPFSEPEPLTKMDNLRFADGIIDAGRGLLYCVREQHLPGQEAINTIVSIQLDSTEESGHIVAGGHDFYAAPRLNADGSQLAWLAWNHPCMPWDGTELWVADLDVAGRPTNARKIAGGPTESITQPQWLPDGSLVYISDQSNWWNLYRWHNGRITPLYPLDAEFAPPQWVFGVSSYGIESTDSLICSYTRSGIWYLGRLHISTGHFTPFDLPFTTISNVQVGAGFVVFIGGAANRATAVIRLDLHTQTWEVLRQSTQLTVDNAYLSMPQPIEFPTANGQTAFGIFYPPQNRDFAASVDEKPPLLVISHGGPTSSTSTRLNLGLQYWTSRGFGVLDVDYGGSTGYGRAYRQRLNGQWGIVDVQDCINGASYLAAQGLVDGQRMAIRGGSAGGFTTLCALTFYDLFSAGASYFGVSDVEALARDTHKFESRYLDSLIGPYPEMRDTYIARSPIHAVDQINCPLILFQGLEDKVVPPNQSEMMYEAVKANGQPVAYVAFAGEQHGFRRADNIKAAMDGELYFYGRIFGFPLATPVKPIPIANLD